ncbi:hypothetical protein G6O67_004848 [Ophiocordyceps sinensis]|uniref:Uncharacterized protein n=1 Tax=Ophiocordyceps sinensis TaxID=72228 RepID=A0A8H4PQC5_9HYPO|nr:hypothetical protein G6O67_004848 [Ophiocordyceps sinensis]
MRHLAPKKSSLFQHPPLLSAFLSTSPCSQPLGFRQPYSTSSFSCSAPVCSSLLHPPPALFNHGLPKPPPRYLLETTV